jgi:hypothetical protein
MSADILKPGAFMQQESFIQLYTALYSFASSLHALLLPTLHN